MKHFIAITAYRTIWLISAPIVYIMLSPFVALDWIARNAK